MKSHQPSTEKSKRKISCSQFWTIVWNVLLWIHLL